jgi:hypothetical protein
LSRNRKPLVIIDIEDRPVPFEKKVKKALDTSTRVAIQGGSVGFMKLQTVYFQYVPNIFAFIFGLQNLGKTSRTSDKSEGFRLSTGVENSVENSNAALEAVLAHLASE